MTKENGYKYVVPPCAIGLISTITSIALPRHIPQWWSKLKEIQLWLGLWRRIKLSGTRRKTSVTCTFCYFPPAWGLRRRLASTLNWSIVFKVSHHGKNVCSCAMNSFLPLSLTLCRLRTLCYGIERRQICHHLCPQAITCRNCSCLLFSWSHLCSSFCPHIQPKVSLHFNRQFRLSETISCNVPYFMLASLLLGTANWPRNVLEQVWSALVYLLRLLRINPRCHYSGSVC